jgi:oligopeptide transport system substrate-binding protein
MRTFGSTTPPAGNVLRFNNGAEPETIDPALAVGQPDGRVCRILFEGLTAPDPVTLAPLPGQAARWDVSADGRTYTFHLRPGLRWSDGTPLAAGDFAWSWLRVLAPATAARNASLLYPILNAEAYNQGALADAARVGVHARDDSTLVVTLGQPTAYFLFLTQFYTYLPVPRHVVTRFGNRWTLPGHLVCNGPFVLESWRQGDHFDFARNPAYWDAANVKLDRVTAYAVEDRNTSVNLYKAGVIDWTTSGFIPSPFIPYLEGYADFQHARYQGVYFYALNVTRRPLDNPWVRRALNFAVDRDAIARDVLKGMRDPWGNFVASGYPGYAAPPGIRFDPAKARDCLSRAGYPGGQNFPSITILVNGDDPRRTAEAIQGMWKRVLGIDVRITSQEWGSYLQSQSSLQYDVVGRSWVGDYPDPNTFLAIMVTGDGNNRTGWGDARYDALIRRAAWEPDAAKRLGMLAMAEAIVLDGSPVIPIYHMTVNDLVKPWVRGISPTALDTHPLKSVWIDRAWRSRPAMAAAERRR